MRMQYQSCRAIETSRGKLPAHISNLVVKALNTLVFEFLQDIGYHYTLSVFASESGCDITPQRTISVTGWPYCSCMLILLLFLWCVIALLLCCDNHIQNPLLLFFRCGWLNTSGFDAVASIGRRGVSASSTLSSYFTTLCLHESFTTTTVSATILTFFKFFSTTLEFLNSKFVGAVSASARGR